MLNPNTDFVEVRIRIQILYLEKDPAPNLDPDPQPATVDNGGNIIKQQPCC